MRIGFTVLIWKWDKIRFELVTTAAATTYPTTSKGGFAGEIDVFGHGFLQWIIIIAHHGVSEIPTFVRFNANEMLRATTQENHEGGEC